MYSDANLVREEVPKEKTYLARNFVGCICRRARHSKRAAKWHYECLYFHRGCQTTLIQHLRGLQVGSRLFLRSWEYFLPFDCLFGQPFEVWDDPSSFLQSVEEFASTQNLQLLLLRGPQQHLTA